MKKSPKTPPTARTEKSPKKPPKPFRKPLKARKYQKKLAGRIYLEPDRKFLASITTTDENDRIILSRELTKEEHGRLKKLKKAARKNRGGLRMARFVILAVLVGAVVVFNYLFKDRLVTRGAEDLLEGLFEAQVELSDVNFRLLGGEISFSSLTIADADAPMQNLLELSTGVLRLDSWQLVNGHVLIDELTVDGLQFGTAREVSGALAPIDAPDGERAPGTGAATAAGSGAASNPSGGGLVDKITNALPPISFADLGLPDTLDAQLFLEQNIDALGTTAAVQAIASTATGFVERWTGEVTALTSELTGIVDEVQTFASTDFTSIRSVDSAMSVFDDATAIQATVTGMTTRIESQYNTLVAEAAGILQAARALPDQARSDYESLVARIPDVRAEGKDFVVGLVEPYVREALGDWYDRIFRVLDIYERLTADGGERKPRRGKRTGTDIDFATTAYPRFLLSTATLGVGATDQEVLSTTIANLSTQPDLIDAPTLINYRQIGRGGRLVVGATLDGRTGAATPLDLSITTSDTPLAIERGLEMLNLSSVTGVVALGGELRRGGTGSFDGALDLVADQIVVAGEYEPKSLGAFIADLFNDAALLEGAFGFTIASRSDVQIHSAATNLDELVADAVRDLIDSTIAAFKQELNDRVIAYLDPVINSLTDKLDGIIDIETSAEELLALARDREAAAAELERLAQNSIAALRDQLEASARAALDAAKAEVEARAQAAADAAKAEAQRIAAESEAKARAAAAEAEAQARAAADEAKAAAEQAARDAAEEAASGAAETIRDALPILPRRR